MPSSYCFSEEKSLVNINHHCLPLIVSFLVAEFKGHRSKKTLTSEGVLFGHHIIDKYFASKAHFGCAHHLHKKGSLLTMVAVMILMSGFLISDNCGK